jgi:hypothetical protein
VQPGLLYNAFRASFQKKSIQAGYVLFTLSNFYVYIIIEFHTLNDELFKREDSCQHVWSLLVRAGRTHCCYLCITGKHPTLLFEGFQAEEFRAPIDDHNIVENFPASQRYSWTAIDGNMREQH